MTPSARFCNRGCPLRDASVSRDQSAGHRVVQPMKSRPLVAFLTTLVPYPPPLIGSMLRNGRLARELQEDFDLALVCQSEFDADTIASNWDLARPFVEVIRVPRPAFDPTRDALWGSAGETLKSTLLSLRSDEPPRILRASWSDAFVDEMRRLLQRLPIDVVWAAKIWTAEMARAAGAQRIFLDIDDFQGALLVEELNATGFYVRKPFHRLQARHLVRYERDLPKRFASIAVSKPEDVGRLASEHQKHVHIVPNGVDVPDVVVRDAFRPREMLFVGALAWEPNVVALTNFVASALPQISRALPGVRLIVAGRGPAPDSLAKVLDRPDIELHESPASLRGFYERAAISVLPLETGGGTSIKTIESLAYAMPTVASSVAARGLGMEHERHLLIADSPDDLARCCIRLLQQPGEARVLGENGRAEVIRRLSWKLAGARARSAIHELMNSAAR